MTEEELDAIVRKTTNGEGCHDDVLRLVAELRKHRSAYLGAGIPWADFLHHRARAMRAMRDEGRRHEEIAVALSMDGPTQVRLILAHVDEHPEEYR